MMLGLILRHPLNRDRQLGALGDIVRWQIASRIAGEAIAMPFMSPTRLLVRRGMTGATGNIYCGLHEFTEMAFLLHLLRPGDLFVDVGANVGSYTVLAAGVCGARTVAVEPAPKALAALRDNLRLNELEGLVRLVAAAIGEADGDVLVSTDSDTTNHVVTEGMNHGAVVKVPLRSLDSLLADTQVPLLIKIDVEGFEPQVLAGARRTLADARLKAVIVEENGSGRRFDNADSSVRELLEAHGFEKKSYDASRRALIVPDTGESRSDNCIFVRDVPFVAQRVASAPYRKIKNSSI